MYTIFTMNDAQQTKSDHRVTKDNAVRLSVKIGPGTSALMTTGVISNLFCSAVSSPYGLDDTLLDEQVVIVFTDFDVGTGVGYSAAIFQLNLPATQGHKLLFQISGNCISYRID